MTVRTCEEWEQLFWSFEFSPGTARHSCLFADFVRREFAEEIIELLNLSGSDAAVVRDVVIACSRDPYYISAASKK